jgi:hypothetical protein
VRGAGLITAILAAWLLRSPRRTTRPACAPSSRASTLPGRFGVRLEDIVTVTEDGGRRLNNTSHDLAIVA